MYASTHLVKWPCCSCRFSTRSCLSICTRMATTLTSTFATAGSCWTSREVRQSPGSTRVPSVYLSHPDMFCTDYPYSIWILGGIRPYPMFMFCFRFTESQPSQSTYFLVLITKVEMKWLTYSSRNTTRSASEVSREPNRFTDKCVCVYGIIVGLLTNSTVPVFAELL